MNWKPVWELQLPKGIDTIGDETELSILETSLTLCIMLYIIQSIQNAPSSVPSKRYGIDGTAIATVDWKLDSKIE